MAKLKFDYTAPIDIQTVGAEMNPIFIINTETLELQGTYCERQRRLDTGYERVLTEKPVPFTIHLTPEVLGQMMSVVIPLALQQDVLRPAIPAVEVPPPPEPPPEVPPEPPAEPPRVRLVPTLITAAPSEVVHFEATVFNTTETAVTWTALDGGIIDAEGNFTCPTDPGDYRVLVQLDLDPTRSSVSIVTVA